MKKLFLFALAVLMVPAAAGAVTFNNMSGTASMKISETSFSSLNQQITQAVNLVNGSDRALITGIAGEPGVFFFEDHLSFTGSNNASMIVQGNILTVTNNRLSGPAAFTFTMPTSISPTGKTTRVEIKGAAKVNTLVNNNRATVQMTFQPSSVVFNSFSSGSLTGTKRSGDAAITVPLMAKTFSSMSSTALPAGFGNISGLSISGVRPGTAGFRGRTSVSTTAGITTTSGAVATAGTATTGTTTTGTTQVANGTTLFQQNCQSCHGQIQTTSVRGRSAAQIQTAINKNTGGMGILKGRLTAQQIQAIAAALNSPATASGFQNRTGTAATTGTGFSTRTGVTAGTTTTTTGTTATGTGATGLTRAQLSRLSGPVLYAQFCQECHGALPGEEQGAQPQQIQQAINSNTGGMGALSFLTPGDLRKVSSAMRRRGPVVRPNVRPSGIAPNGIRTRTLSGPVLYAQFCQQCHGPIGSSEEKGATPQRIQLAIVSNTGGMGTLSFLTTSDLTRISAAMRTARPTNPVFTPGSTVTTPSAGTAAIGQPGGTSGGVGISSTNTGTTANTAGTASTNTSAASSTSTSGASINTSGTSTTTSTSTSAGADPPK